MVKEYIVLPKKQNISFTSHIVTLYKQKVNQIRWIHTSFGKSDPNINYRQKRMSDER